MYEDFVIKSANIGIKDKDVYEMFGIILKRAIDKIAQNTLEVSDEEFETYLSQLSEPERERLRQEPERLVKSNANGYNDMLAYLDDLSEALNEMHDHIAINLISRLCESHSNESFQNLREVIFSNHLQRLSDLDRRYSQARTQEERH